MRFVRLMAAGMLAASLAACASTPPKGIDFEDVRLDPQGLIAPDLLEEALASYQRHRGTVAPQTRIFDLPTRRIESRVSPVRTDRIGIIDFRLPGRAKRFFLVDMVRGSVQAVRVAHGDGSGAGDRARFFSNLMDTNASSVGAYVAANQYEDGRWPGSVRLHGLDATNSCAFYRAIVMHEAAYMTPGDQGRVGNSDGCLALSKADRPWVTAEVRDGVFIYAGPVSLHTPSVADGKSTQAAPDSAEPATGF
jgi:hypothetical protein